MKLLYITTTLLLSCAVMLCQNLYAQQFPAYQVTAYDSSLSSGYFFITPFKRPGTMSQSNPYHFILDRQGRMVYFKEFIPGSNTGSFCIQPNGIMSYSANGKFFLMDSTFTVIDSIKAGNGIFTDGHELQVLPNGNFLLLGFEFVTMDLSSYNMFMQNGSPGSSNANVKCNVIQELDPSMNVVFEWHCRDHFAFADVDEAFLSGPLSVDWTHCNALEQDVDGNFLLSTRHFNEITKISRSDSSVIWRLGGKQNQFVFTNDSQQFKGQHDIRVTANGNITLFDNGAGGSIIHPASAKEYFIDNSAMTATLAWSYVENPNSYSRSMGSVNRDIDGNTILNYGTITNSNILLNRVDSNGQKIFEIEFADSLASYRSYHYNSLPWDMNRPVVSCFDIGGQYFLDAGPGHASYLWSDGSTTQLIPYTMNDTFFVFVPKGQGGYISSEWFTAPCFANTVNEHVPAGISLSPNPANGKVKVEFSLFSDEHIAIRIYSQSGQLTQPAQSLNLKKGENVFTFDTSSLSGGVYYLQLSGIEFFEGRTFIVR